MDLSYRDISKHIEEMYGTKVSVGILSQITDKVILDIKAWQNRPLDPIYPIVRLAAIHFRQALR